MLENHKSYLNNHENNDIRKQTHRHRGRGTSADAEKIGVSSLDELIEKTIPANILLKEPLKLGAAMTEREFAEHIGELAAQNKLYKTYIGCGWYDTVTPAVVQRNVFENPVGTLPIRPIRLKFPRDDWSVAELSDGNQRSDCPSAGPTVLCWMKRRLRRKQLR